MSACLLHRPAPAPAASALAPAGWRGRPTARMAGLAGLLSLWACGAAPEGMPLSPALQRDADAALVMAAAFADMPAARLTAADVRIRTTENVAGIDGQGLLQGRTQAQGDHFEVLIVYSPQLRHLACGTALIHELYHVALQLKTGDGDAQHTGPRWPAVDAAELQASVCGP